MIGASGGVYFDFDLAVPGKNAPIRGRRRFPHIISEPAIGPSGPIGFTMQDWVQGMQTVEEGIEYRQKPKYISSKGVDAAFPGQVLIQPMASTIPVSGGSNIATAPIQQIDFTASGGSVNTYLAIGAAGSGQIYNLNGSLQWQTVASAGAAYTDLVSYSNQLGAAYSTAYQYSASGASGGWTNQATAADRWGTLGANLYRAVRPNTIYAGSGSMTPSWDSGSTIADSGYNINSLVGIEQVLLIGKEDGVYSIDSDGTVVPFTPELRPQATSVMASLPGSVSFNGDYYFRTLNGIIKISGGDGTKTRVGLDQLSSPDLPVSSVVALAADDRYLYALCANTSAGLAILRRGVSGAWNVFYYDSTATNGQHLAVSAALGYQALFFSYTSGSVWITKYIRLSSFPNALQDPNYAYDAVNTGRFRVGRFGTAEAQMVIDQMTIQSRQCAAGITITPYYSADGGAITQFGATAITTNPFTTIKPTTAVTCNYIDLYFDLATNSATTSPILVGFSMKGAFRPNHRRVHSFNFISTRGHAGTRTGNRLTAPTETAANLETLLATNTYQNVIDERGATFQGLVHDVSRLTLDIDPADEPDEFIQCTIWEKS